MYTQESIEKIKDLAIVDVIGKFITLKPSGSGYKAKSPFVDEKTPSFMVSPVKEIFKCFASAKGGSSIDFVMQHKGLSFIEAVEYIAKDHNVLLERVKQTPEEKQRRAKKDEFYKIAKATQLKYVKQFNNLPQDHWAIELLNKRGYNQDVFIEWQLGFADNSGVITKEIKEKGGLLGAAKEIGIIGGENQNLYDFFRNRIIFPIFDHNSSCIGFGGRRSNGDDKSAKYINSIDSEIYLKKKVLYGLHIAKGFIRKQGYAILVEGYTDVITMHKKGANNTIATCGTALTDDQAKLLKKFTNKIFLMRDGDRAGITAMERDLKVLLRNGFQVHVFQLPEGEDPDDFANKHPMVSEVVFKGSVDAVLWKTERIAADFVPDSYYFKKDEIEKELSINIQAVEHSKKSEKEIAEIEQNKVSDTEIEALEEGIKSAYEIKQLEESKRDDAKKENKVLSKKIDQALATNKEIEDELKGIADFNKNIDAEIAQLEKEAAKQIKSLVKIDSYKQRQGQEELCELLFYIKHQGQRATYVDQTSKIIGVSAAILKRQLGEKDKRAFEQRVKNKTTPKDLGMPDGTTQVHAEFFIKYGFFEFNNQYYFQTKKGVVPCSNHTITPLYFIDGKEENKRLCEVVNTNGVRRLIDFDSEKVISFMDLRRELVKAENFVFFGIGSLEYELLIQRILNGFERAVPLLSLGQHPKGFFAFANGIYKTTGDFTNSNKYGVIHVPSVEENSKTEDEEYGAYELKDDFYYTPAFSVMHRKNQKGDDPYENDRYFVYKKSSITLASWMESMVYHYGNKGVIGIVFNFSALFRDVFLDKYRSFPLLGGIGEKGSGKSDFGQVLSNFFYYNQKPLFLPQTTQVAVNTRLSKVRNTVVFMDEYKEIGVKDEVKDTMTNGYGGKGREVGTLKRGQNKSNYIESAIYYAGQFRPTYQENATAERSIILNFPKMKYSLENKVKFEKFMESTSKGMSSLIVDIIQHRDFFMEKLTDVYPEISEDLKNSFDTSGISDRILKNYLVLLVSYKILSEKIDFPFSYQKFKSICILGIQQNSESIQDSDTTTEFWDSVQYMFSKSKAIREGYQFMIDTKQKVKLLVNSNQTKDWVNEDRKELLFLKFKQVHTEYSQYCIKSSKTILDKGSLTDYIKSKPYYVGMAKSQRFKDTSTSCMVLDYSLMKSDTYMLLNLDQAEADPRLDGDKDKDPKQTPAQLKLPQDEKDDFPF